MNHSETLWYVQLSDGDVHRVTLDQLDEGFQAGHIDEKTMVLAAGAARWTSLGQLAALDEGAPALPPPAYANSHRPVSVDLGDLETAAGLPRRLSKRARVAALAFVVITIGVGGVIVKRPSWVAPYWNRLGPQRTAVKSWAAAAAAGFPSLVRRARSMGGTGGTGGNVGK